MSLTPSLALTVAKQERIVHSWAPQALVQRDYMEPNSCQVSN
jgi:hypothetical protein